MVKTRRTTQDPAQFGLEKSKGTRVAKSNGAALTNQVKRKATQEARQGNSAKGKKRAKKELPTYLHRSHTEHDPNRSIPLLELPREVFDEITHWLTPDALACLCLTCKEILSIVGDESWAVCRSKRGYWDDQDLRHWGSPRQSLIPLLARDTSRLTFCEVCWTLHPPLKPPREHRETKLTKQCFGQWGTIDYLPKSDFGGYSLVWDHILKARESLANESGNGAGSVIALLGGNFTVIHERLNYTLESSGRQIGKNLVLKHGHVFHGKTARSSLRLADIINLPVRLCPHQTTSTQKPEPGRYTKSKLPSGLLSHSITTAAPTSLRVGLPKPSVFSTPAPSEKRQMDTASLDTLWTCRACPTKWRVRYSGAGVGELKITTWHSFGDTPYRAQEYWKMLVRREMSNLGDDKRNSEFFVTTRQYLDFAIDDLE